MEKTSKTERDPASGSERVAQEAQAQDDAAVDRRTSAGPEPLMSAGVVNASGGSAGEAAKIAIRSLDFWYGTNHVLKDMSLDIRANEVTAFIGPSGCGKSTLLRCLNRMNELIPGTRLQGEVMIDGKDIYKNADPVMVRRRIGMVFQKPNPFPKTIYQNVIWGALVNGYRGNRDELVERCLRQAALWDEVKDRLRSQAYSLSGGQQQRLCIARTLAVEPEVVLMDEPASALDPIATAKLEETIHTLKERYTIVVVTHNMQQAGRISDRTAFFYMGELIEIDDTAQIFTRPKLQRTEDYITGRFG